MTKKFDVVVVGSGPGGYVAAIRAAQLGKKVACVEKAEWGGICLNWGCIPTKALIKSADLWRDIQSASRFGININNPGYDFKKVVQHSRLAAKRLSKGVAYLFKKNDITPVTGFGKLTDHHNVEIYAENQKMTATLTADHIILATGAHPRSVPGIEIDHERVITSRDAMVLERQPASMAIIGAGAIGVEFAYIMSTLGCEITLIEMMPHILPNEDSDIVKELTRALKKQKINILANTKVDHLETDDEGVKLTVVQDKTQESVRAQYALMAVGVAPNINNLGLEKTGIKVEKGIIKTNQNYQTTVDNIYAIGDVIGEPFLAHVASAEGVYTVEKMLHQDPAPVNYDAIPACTYCHPQVASVGLTEQTARARGLDLRIGKFPFRANGKSVVSGETDGLVKVIMDNKSNQLLGTHILGAEATELLPELSLALNEKLGRDAIKANLHAHPTLSEAIREAVLNAYDEAIHI